jgi:fatty-acyl-CoA synthase
LYQHPSIEAVEVIGVPDKKFGEQICAWIKKKRDANLTEQDVKTFCKEKMAHYKIPHYILFVDSFPMTLSYVIIVYLHLPFQWKSPEEYHARSDH